MNSKKIKNSNTKIRETVQNICTILDNIKKLKNSNNENNTTLVLQSEEILEHLEKSLPKIKKIMQKRKLQRQQKKIKRLKLKKAIIIKLPPIRQEPTENHAKKREKNEIKPKRKLHVQLRKKHDAEEYLKKIDLIIKLHQARARNTQASEHFAAQFDNLIAIWSSIKAQNDLKEEETIEQQWQQVLYGEAQQQQNFSYEPSTSKSFRRIRRTWNSYLSRNSKMASQLQADPVLPSEVPDSRWKLYCLQD